VGCVLGIGGTLAAQTAVQKAAMIHSSTWEWTAFEAKPTKVGKVISVVRAPTPTLDELEMHITTLNPGEMSHPPHKHPEEELLIVKEGTVEMFQDGATHRLGAGSIIFNASNEMHNIRNVGSTPATYHVIQWRVPGAAK
jgi:uncharacterized cupin superfamily protein